MLNLLSIYLKAFLSINKLKVVFLCPIDFIADYIQFWIVKQTQKRSSKFLVPFIISVSPTIFNLSENEKKL